MKSKLALVLAVMMLLSASACGKEKQAEEFQVEIYHAGDCLYSLREDGTAVFVDYTGSERSLTVPSVLDGHPVTAIGDGAFWYTPDNSDLDKKLNILSYPAPPTLNTIIIPDSVTDISDRAFSGCFTLKSVTLPDSIPAPDTNLFIGCTGLTEIRVSDDHPFLETINGVLFSKEGRRLISYPAGFDAEEYTVPDGTETIGRGAFYDCDNLIGITLPDSVTSINDYAFAFCENLVGINIPDGVTAIGSNAFAACSGLAAVPIPDGITVISDGMFLSGRGLTSITIPESVTAIGDRAFDYCENLTSITIPDSVTSIGKNAFSHCPNITVTVGRDSYARKYCRRNNIPYIYPDGND